MYKLESAAGRTVRANGKDYLFFSGYSYLGMGGVQEFTDLVKEGIDRFGLLHPSARISNTILDVFSELEQRLTVLTGQDKTISFSSGYLAGRAVAELFIKDKEAIILAGTHPVLKGDQPVFYGTMQELVNSINDSSNKNITVVSDSINPLTAAITDFAFLREVSRDKRITCIIDDSHGVGLIGVGGKGIVSFLPKQENITYVLTYSLSKAFHINGGAVSSTNNIITQLGASPFYTGSTPIAPAYAYAFNTALHLYSSQLKKLQQNSSYFGDLLRIRNDVQYHPALPIFVLPEVYDESFFESHNIIISSFSYPNPTGRKINRIVLSALHTHNDLDTVIAALK